MEHAVRVASSRCRVKELWRAGVVMAATVACCGGAPPGALAQGEYPEVPPIFELTDEVKAPLLAGLAERGVNFADIEIVIVADGKGGIAALHPGAEKARPLIVDESAFVLPEIGTDFSSAAVVFESSPGTLVTCGPPPPRNCQSVP